MQSRLVRENARLINENARAYFQVYSAFRWLGVRVELIGALVGLVVGIIAVLSPAMSAGAVGLLLSLAASVTGALNWFIRVGTQVESNMNNVERIFTMTATPPEAPLEIAGQRPPRGWPSDGRIQFAALEMRYRPDLDPVLKRVSFTVEPREKIGVVGRTGAGKSSLTNALFRLVEPSAGAILIDGEDIARFGLGDVRRNLSIIPQDPVLFSGTLRSNLDPFGTRTDQQLWEVLERVHLRKYVAALPGKLDSAVTESTSLAAVCHPLRQSRWRQSERWAASAPVHWAGASSRSQNPRHGRGDRIRGHRDGCEFTYGSCGTDTLDALIQQTVRTEFADKTVLTIAHRLNTIMDSDKVLVLDRGEVKEYDAPGTLLQRPDGFFSELVAKTGKKSASYLRSIARQPSTVSLI